jgi:hypothetical protein
MQGRWELEVMIGLGEMGYRTPDRDRYHIHETQWPTRCEGNQSQNALLRL